MLGGMRKKRGAYRLFSILVLLAMLSSLVFPAGAVAAQPGERGQGAPYVPGELIVKFKPGVTSAGVGALLSQVEASEVKVSRLGARLVRLQGGADVETALARLQADPAVAYAEPNYIYKASQTAPNDAYYSDQWGLPAVQAPQAWEGLASGSGSVTVAVVDTGVDYTHPDLTGRVDTANDKDYVNGDAAGDDADGAMDDNGHGTHVAGIVAATTNNGTGIAGVAGEYPVTILPVKVLDAEGSGTVFDVAAGIEHAASRGAGVINLSLGGPGYSQTLADAVAYAQNVGALVVAAAGNENDVVDYYYPAALPGVLTVGAVEQTETGFNRAWFSNYGQALDVVAPGVEILSTVPGSVGGALYEEETGAYYDSYGGTSMAAPFVSGVAALLKLANPNQGAAEVAARITGSALDLGDSGRDDYYGYGLVQAAAALGVTPEVPAVTFSSPADGSQVFGRLELVAQVGQPDLVQAVGFYLNQDGTEEQLGVAERVYAGQPQTLYRLAWDTASVLDGQYTLTARAKDANQNDLGDPASITVVVKNTVSTGLQFQVSNPDGSPAAGAVVVIWHRMNQPPWPEEPSCPVPPAALTQEPPPGGGGGGGGAPAPPPQPYWYEPWPAYVGFADSQGQLRVPGSWTTDLNEYTAVILAVQEDAAARRLSPVLYVRQLEAPELVVVDGSRAVQVDFTAHRFGETAGELLPLDGAEIWTRVFDAQGVPLPFPLPLSLPLLGLGDVLDEQGSMTAYLDAGNYDFHALSWEYSYYLQQKNVGVTSGGGPVAVDFSLEDASRVTVDLQDIYSSAYLYLFDDQFSPAFGFPVTEGEELVVTSGSYWPGLDLQQEQEGEGVVQKWNYYLKAQEPHAFAPGEVALQAGGGLTASIDPWKTALYPGGYFDAASKFEDNYGFRLWGGWVEEEPAAQAGAAKLSGPLMAVHYPGQQPQRFQWEAPAYTWQQLPGNRAAGDVSASQDDFWWLDPQLRILYNGEELDQDKNWMYYFWLWYALAEDAAPGLYQAELSLDAGPLGSPLAVTDFTVLPSGTSVAMQVYGPDGSPAAGAWVKLLAWRTEPGYEEGYGWWGWVFDGYTGLDGTFPLPAGLVLKDGQQYLLTVTGQVPVEPGSEPFFLYRQVSSLEDLQLVDGTSAQRVEVQVTDKVGNGLDAWVDATLVPPFGKPTWEISPSLGDTGSDGTLSAWLDPGTYHVTGARWPWGEETDAYYLLAPAQDIPTPGQEPGSVAATVYLRGEDTGSVTPQVDPAFSDLTLAPFTNLMDWTGGFFAPASVSGSLHLSPGTYRLMAHLGREDQDGYWGYWEEAGWSDESGLTITPDTNRGISFSPRFTATLDLVKNLLTPGEVLQGTPVFADDYGNRVRDVWVWPYEGRGYDAQTRFALTPEGRVQALDADGRLKAENHREIAPFLSIYRGDERIFHEKEWKNYWQVDWPVPLDAASGGYRAQVALQVGPKGVVSASQDFQVVGGGPVILEPRDHTLTNNPELAVSGRAEPNTEVQVWRSKLPAWGDEGRVAFRFQQVPGSAGFGLNLIGGALGEYRLVQDRGPDRYNLVKILHGHGVEPEVLGSFEASGELDRWHTLVVDKEGGHFQVWYDPANPDNPGEPHLDIMDTSPLPARGVALWVFSVPDWQGGTISEPVYFDDFSFTPAGSAAASFTDDFSNPDSLGTIWTRDGGDWRIENDVLVAKPDGVLIADAIPQEAEPPATVGADGTWQTTLNLDQGDGPYVIWAENQVDSSVLDSNRVHVVLDTTAPVAPGLQATALDPKHVKLTWSNAPGEYINAVEVYRQDGASTDTIPPEGSLLAKASPVKTEYTDSTAQPQTTYTYWVAYVDLAGNRSYSTPASLTTPAEQQTINLRSVSFSVPRGNSGYAKIGGNLVVTALGDAGKAGKADIKVLLIDDIDGNEKEETINLDLSENPAGVYKGTYTIPAGVTAIQSVQAALADPSNPSLVSETKPAPGTPVNVGGSITGRVTKGDSGLAGTQVSAWSNTAGSGGWATTGEDGSYDIAGLAPADDYTVSVSAGAENYWQQAAGVGVAAGIITAGVDFQVPATYTVNVRAIDDRDLGPDVTSPRVVAGIWVSLSSTATDYSAWGYTDENGVAAFSRVPEGNDYTLSTSWATWRGYLDRTWENVNLPDAGQLSEDGTVLALDFPLESREKYTGKITGTVTDANTGEPVENVSVSAWSNSAGTGAWASTDADGKYELQDLAPAEDYVLTFSHPDYFEESRSNVAVTAGVELPINMPLNPGNTITGVVYGQKEGQDPLEMLAGVNLSARDNAGHWFWTTSAAGGAFTFKKLPEGTFTVSTSNRLGYADRSQENVQVNNSEPLVFTLPEAGSIDGYVKDVNGSPISYVYINVQRTDDGWGYGWARTGSDGYFKVRGLSAGTYSLTTSNYKGYIDQTKADIIVQDGKTTRVKDIVLLTPEDAGKAFSGSGNGFAADSAAAAPGQVLTYKASYQNNRGATASGVKLLLDIPEHTTLVNGSVVLNGNSVADTVYNGKLEVTVGDVPGNTGGWASYQVQVNQDLTSELSFLATGSVQWTLGEQTFEATLGAASTELVFTTIQGPTVTSSRTIKVFGKSLPGALVKVFDGDALLGQTTASGRWWTVEVTLPVSGLAAANGDTEEIHSLTAQAVLADRASNPSAPLEVLYRATIPRVEDVKVTAGWNGTVSVNPYVGLVTLGVTEKTPMTVQAKFDSVVSNVYFTFLDESYPMSDADGDDHYKGKVPYGWVAFGEHPITLVFTAEDGRQYQLPICWILVLIDPSGYVYEAVPDNRLPGVMARVEQKVGGNWVPWDAAKYGQVNPQTTDEQGRFGWDVPAGEWRVVFSKDDYETLTSEVVSVPPPKTDLNVGLVSTATPAVTARTPANGATGVNVTGTITVEFSKYMKVSTFTAGTFTLVRLDAGGNPAGDPVSASISGVNAVNGLAKSIRLDPDSNLAYSTKYQVTVDATVEDYSGRHPAGDVSWTFTTASAPGGGAPGGGGGAPGGGGGAPSGGGAPAGGTQPTQPAPPAQPPAPAPGEVTKEAVEQAIAASPAAPAVTLQAAVQEGKAELTVAAEALQLLQQRGKGVVVEAGAVRAQLPAAVLQGLNLNTLQQLAGTAENLAVRLEISEVGPSQAAAYLRTAPSGMSAVQGIDLQLSVLAGGQAKGRIGGFDASVTVTVQLTRQALAGKNVDLLGAYYLNEATGALEYVGGTYDAASGNFRFTTTHWSKYLILEYKKEFADLPADHWAHGDVQVMAARHIAGGVSPTEFAPEANITRAQFAALLVRALGLKPDAAAAPVFQDVQPGQWFFGDVATAYRAGLVSGYGGGKFAPDNPITRQEMAAMIVRALDYLKKTPALDAAEVSATLAGFKDGQQVADWAQGAVAVAVKARIIRGRGAADTLAPAGLTTRAEGVVMLKRFMQAGGLL